MSEEDISKLIKMYIRKIKPFMSSMISNIIRCFDGITIQLKITSNEKSFGGSFTIERCDYNTIGEYRAQDIIEDMLRNLFVLIVKD